MQPAICYYAPWDCSSDWNTCGTQGRQRACLLYEFVQPCYPVFFAAWDSVPVPWYDSVATTVHLHRLLCWPNGDHHRGNNFHVNKFWGNLEKEQSTIKHHALGQKSWVGSCWGEGQEAAEITQCEINFDNGLFHFLFAHLTENLNLWEVAYQTFSQ